MSTWKFPMICFIIIMHRIYSVSGCPVNVRVYTEEGQRPILNFSVVLDTSKYITTFTVSRYDKRPCLLINYKYGQPLGSLVLQNGCTMAPTTDLSRGIMDVQLGTVASDDQGIYELIEVNQDVTSLKCYTLYILGIPTLPTISASGSLYVGTSLTLTCSSTSTTSPSNHSLTMRYSWTLDGSSITPGEKFSFDTSLQRQLTISNLSRNDDQTVIGCTAIEERGETSQLTAYTIIIAYGPENIRFNPTADSQSYNEGDNFSPITCLADCHPNCTFSWKKGSTIMSSTSALDLGLVNSAKLGTYTCTAIHTVSTHTLTKTLNVSVIYGPDNVSLYPPNSSYTVTEGDTLGAITCSATCNPACTYTWSRSGATFSHAATLDLGQVDRGKAGSYVCMARNKVSNFSMSGQTVNVTVRYGPDSVTLNVPNINTFTEGDAADNIECSADCWPGCMFTWTNLTDNQLMSTSAVLVLGTVNRYDAGYYMCLAKNSAPQFPREAEKHFTLHVQYAPDVVIIQSSTLLHENNPLDLLCKASGVPAVYNYTGFVQRVGGVVVPNSHVKSLGLRDSISVNNPSLQLQDTGMYTCYVHNGIIGLNKQLLQTASRRIEVSASPQFFMMQIFHIGEKSGNITVAIPFVSYPEFTSYSVIRHDGLWVFPSGKYTLQMRNETVYPVFYGQQVALSGNVLQITIYNLSEKDFGIYAIQITNDVNTTKFSIDVEASGKPDALTEVNLTTLDNTVLLEWKKGFNVGHNQTFVLQTSLNSDDSWVNVTIIQESESKFIKENGKFQVKLTNLDPGVYNARLVAFNIIGAADPVEFKKNFEIMELTKEPSQQTRGGPIIGGTVGGIAAILVVAIIIVLIVRRKYKFDCDCDCACSFNMTKREDLDEDTHSKKRKDTQVADNPGYNAAETYEAVSMATDTMVYDALKCGNNGSDNAHVYTPLKSPSLKSHANYENVKKEDPVYNNTMLKNPVQTVL